MRRLLVALLLLSSLGLAQKRPFTFEDMMALKRVGEPAVSPDGRWVAFSAVEVNLDENTRKPHLWVVPTTGGEVRQLYSAGPGEDRPRWSPDGKRIAFVSSRTGGSQIWAADFDPTTVSLGEPKQITNISTEADGELWSPDGKYILFTSAVWPDCKDDACNKQRDEARAASKVKASIFTRLFYRHWTTYASGKRTHIFIQPVDGSAPSPSTPNAGVPGAPVPPLDLTPGDHDAPPFSLGGQDMYAFSPDGKEIAFTSNIDEVEATSTNNEIFIVPVTGGTPKKISTSPGSDSTPLYSPDGRYIAWRMQERAGYESDRFQLVIYDRSSGQIRSLTKDFDRWVGSVVWAPDSKGLFFTAEDKGEAPIYFVGLGAAGSAEIPTGRATEYQKYYKQFWAPSEVIRGHNDDLGVTPRGDLLFTRMSVQAPNEIFTYLVSELAKPSIDQPPVTPPPPPFQMTRLNDSVLSRVSMQPLEPFWFTGSQKAKVQGFIVKPPNFDASKKYPVKFLIHGGPEGAWGDSWTYRWNAQLFAADGYVVVMINPRGSTGYGQNFIDDVNGDWGGRAYQDLMLGLDYVEKTYPFIDRDRECALGASYGGYMVNWIMGHTNRFKCIVSHDGMFNSESAYGTTEELWFNEWEFRGMPWTNRALYRRWSPHLFADKFATPTLVVHGQLDYRLDVSEGFQLFTTLQRRGVESKMLYFPDEGHWVLKPQNSRLWYKTVNDWVDAHTKSAKP